MFQCAPVHLASPCFYEKTKLAHLMFMEEKPMRTAKCSPPWFPPWAHGHLTER